MEFITGPFLWLWVVPLVINYQLAKNSGKNTTTVSLLTLLFSWLITISLFSTYLLNQEGEAHDYSGNNVCPICDRAFRSGDSSCFLCSINQQLQEGVLVLNNDNHCSYCNRQNRIDDISCYACGSDLQLQTQLSK
ncbi:MAG: hypothetical protein OEM02_02670 [Desulfobulbaceae bacterium]|nr:hypothetical protein [Desulfobulbaceae bacterium]